MASSRKAPRESRQACTPKEKYLAWLSAAGVRRSGTSRSAWAGSLASWPATGSPMRQKFVGAGSGFSEEAVLRYGPSRLGSRLDEAQMAEHHLSHALQRRRSAAACLGLFNRSGRVLGPKHRQWSVTAWARRTGPHERRLHHRFIQHAPSGHQAAGPVRAETGRRATTRFHGEAHGEAADRRQRADALEPACCSRRGGPRRRRRFRWRASAARPSC